MSSVVGSEKSFRNALGCYSTGVAVVTCRSTSGASLGLTVNSFASVSLEPRLVLWSLRKVSPSLDAFQDSQYFAINVLGEEQRDLSNHFATPIENKFDGVDHRRGIADLPILRNALAVFQCRHFKQVDAGDHVIFIGEVVDWMGGGGRPLIFQSGSYRRISRQDDTGAPADDGNLLYLPQEFF